MASTGEGPPGSKAPARQEGQGGGSAEVNRNSLRGSQGKEVCVEGGEWGGIPGGGHSCVKALWAGSRVPRNSWVDVVRRHGWCSEQGPSKGLPFIFCIVDVEMSEQNLS